MDNLETFIKKIIELMGFGDYEATIDHEHKHGTIFIRDHVALVKENLPVLVETINHLVQLAAKKSGEAPIFVDINNYRRERENLIAELAKAAARKVHATGAEIPLPAMNSYERRLVHTTLAAHPDVLTESVGAGKGRYVTVKPIREKTAEEKVSFIPLDTENTDLKAGGVNLTELPAGSGAERAPEAATHAE
ncbi:MAG: R3H domain-containing nucleic acid-binding protein [Patescibacteria group bacterium]